MPDYQAMIKRVKEQLKRATEDLEIWESSEAATITDAAGKVTDLRSQMITHAKYNMQKFRLAFEALEKASQKSK